MNTRQFVRRFLVVCVLCVVGVVAAYAVDAVQGAEGPEPAPWWMRVEEAQALAIKWLGALTVIAGALAGFVLFVLGKVNEIRENQKTQAARMDSHGQQLTTLALNTTAAPPAATGEGKPPIPPIALLLVVGCLSLAGCAGFADFLESPTNQKILTIASNAAAASLTQSIGGKLDPAARDAIQAASGAAINGASSAAVFGLAELIRSKQATKDAATAKGIADAARNAGVPDLALPVAKAVVAVGKTAPPDQANEAVAASLDALAAKMAGGAK